MLIGEIAIEGFGIFHDVAIRDLGPGITVFEGHNEAGKTTLMSYIRAILFGFEARRSGNNRYEPARGGRHGGALIVMTEDGKRYRVERVDTGPRGRVKVTPSLPAHHTMQEPGDTLPDEELLNRLLYGTSKLLYQNVFAFGISELERLDTLQADEVSNHIYTVGMGTGLTPLATVQNILESEQAQLFKPGGKKPSINQVIQRLDDTQATIRDLQTLPDEYYALRDRLTVLDREIRKYQRELEEAKGYGDWLESLVRAQVDWEELQVVRQELKDLPTVQKFPAGGVERLEQLDRTLVSLETRLDETRGALKKAEEKRAELFPDPRLLAHQADIEALEEIRGEFKGLLEGLLDLRSRVAFRRKVVDEILTRLGPTWNDERLDRFEASIPIREQIRGIRDRLEESHQQLQDALRTQEDFGKARRERESGLERLQEKLEQLTPPAPPGRAQLEEREEALRHWFQLQHRLELTRQHKQDVRGQVGVLEDQILAQKGEILMAEGQRGLPVWALFLLALVFAIPATFTGLRQEFFMTISLATAGILGVGLLAWWRHDLQVQRQARLEDLRAQYKKLVGRLGELREERTRTDQEEERISEEMHGLGVQALGVEITSTDSAESALRSLEAERRLLERREDLNSRIQADEEALVQILEQGEAAVKVRQAAEQRRDEAQEAWQSFLMNLGLPDELTPDGALEVIAGAERAQGQLGEWRDVAQELQRAEMQAKANSLRLNTVLEKCGWKPVSLADSPAALVALRKALDQSLNANLELERINQLIREKEAERETGEAEKARYCEQLTTLLEAGGANDAETFRRRAVLYARQDELERQQRQLEVALRVHAGERYEEMEHTLSVKNRTELERELYEVTREGQQRLVEILTKHIQEKGRVEQQLQDLEQNERLSSIMLEHQSLLAQMNQHAQRWAVRTICQFLLEKARQVYERERQPAVLREASKFFKVMTEERYHRIMVPLGEMRLEIESTQGPSRPTEILSRGTAEQLYLAMRLAFVREYAKHAGPLPLVVDDIFVNFDPNRAKATIKVLGEIAATHQVLVFTCHPHVSRWFQETIQGLSVREIPACA